MNADLKYRMGTGPGGPNLEDGLAWAAANDFHFLDFNADHSANALATWTPIASAMCAGTAKSTTSTWEFTPCRVNVAEFSPYMSEAVDAYIKANIDLGERLGVDHVITHAGYTRAPSWTSATQRRWSTCARGGLRGARLASRCSWRT